jgi:hypothetical protein
MVKTQPNFDTTSDMIGIKFLNLQDKKVSQNFLKSINRVDTFKLTSYELKREIKIANLKKLFPSCFKFELGNYDI